MFTISQLFIRYDQCMQLIYGKSISISDTISRQEMRCWKRQLNQPFVNQLIMGRSAAPSHTGFTDQLVNETNQYRYSCGNDDYAADLNFIATQGEYQLHLLIQLFNDQLCRHQVIDNYLQGKEQLSKA